MLYIQYWVFTLKQFFSLFSQREINRLFQSILPIPLAADYFNGKCGFSNLIIIGENQRKTRKSNQSYNYTGLNCPYLFKACMVVKTLRHRYRTVMKSIHNTENKPQYQNQNNYQEEMDVSILIINPFHNRCRWVLEPLLPGNRSISKCTKQRTKAKSHFLKKKNIYIY